MDEFAQSRGDDDLFDDEIMPIESAPQPVQEITAQVEQVSLQQSRFAFEHPESQVPRKDNRGRGRGRGRGRDSAPREQNKQNDLAQSKWGSTPSIPRKETSKAPVERTVVSEPPVEKKDVETDHVEPDASSAEPTAAIPSGPSNPTPSRPPAVRGDRTNTGGVARTKLTEEELNAKLLAAKERSQNLSAAHARAQADAESFAARERIATQKRAKETAERKVMDGERERNRERKLRGRGGREWDARKQEDDFAGRGRGDRGRPAPGHDLFEDEQDLSMYEWHEDRGRGRGRGRGGRGGRGRGRGDNMNGQSRGGGIMSQKQPDLQAEADFPALPGSTAPKNDKKPALDRTSSEADPPAGTSWADQVESSEAQKAA